MSGDMKRPRKVKITFVETTTYYSRYKCPFCSVTFEGGGPRKNVTRFLCDCGNELIVDKEK